MEFAAYCAIGVFLVTYVFIISEKVAPSLITIFGAASLILIKVIDQKKAFEHIDWNVLFLLISMMLLVHIVEETGIFQYCAIKAAKIVDANPYSLVIMLFLVTAVFSALLDNITTVVMLAPIAMLLAGELGVTPFPFLITIIFASNIGGTATLIGDPPNVMIGSQAGLGFNDFITNLAPIIAVISLAVIGLILLFFRGKLNVNNQNRARIMDFDEKKMIKNKKTLIRSLAVLVITIIGFFCHDIIHAEVATIALFGASLLMLINKTHVEHAFQKVEWQSIFFFIGLFIIVGSLVETGVIASISNKIMDVSGGNVKGTSLVVLFFAGIMSAVVDNIPFTATMIPIIKNLGTSGMDIHYLWWSLALGACLGGNGTLIGASANIVVANLAKKSGHPIRFMQFLGYGAAVLGVSLVISGVYIIIRYW